MKHIAITENHLYSKTYAKGKKYTADNVVVYVLKDLKAEKLRKSNPNKEYINRIGLTVSRKIGPAVMRSRIKRVLREGLRQVEKEFNVKKGYLVVLVARSNAGFSKSGDIAKDIEKAFEALNLIKNEENN